MTNYPSHWIVSTLGQVANWASGGTPNRGNPDFFGGDIPWCVIGDLNEGLVTETKETITRLGLESSSAKIVDPGTVLLAMYGASIGRTGIAGTPMATNQAIACGVFDEKQFDLEYVLLYLQSEKNNLMAAGQGGAQPNISQGLVRAWKIPIPPIEEQRRIVQMVAKLQLHLDKALISMQSITGTKSSWTINGQIGLLRDSIRKAAFTGALSGGAQ